MEYLRSVNDNELRQSENRNFLKYQLMLSQNFQIPCIFFNYRNMRYADRLSLNLFHIYTSTLIFHTGKYLKQSFNYDVNEQIFILFLLSYLFAMSHLISI